MRIEMNSNGDALLKQYLELVDDALDHAECGYRRPRPEIVITREEVQPYMNPEQELAEIAAEIGSCRKCGLHEGRKNTVPGYGVLNPLVMCIGEAPGADEDTTGRPFVGKAGQYLDKWLAAIDLSRDSNCFIGNIIKCRPPGNRDPQPEEMEACLPYLRRQLKVIRPRMILALGRISAQILSGTQKGIGVLRGETFTYMDILCASTYHPSAVLRNQEYRKPVWDDLRKLKDLLPDD